MAHNLGKNYSQNKTQKTMTNAPNVVKAIVPTWLRGRVFASVLVALLLSIVTINLAQAAVTNTTATIGGQTSVTTYPGVSLSVEVTVARNGGTDYDSTSYSWVPNPTNADYTCIDTDNNDNSGNATHSETISVFAPTTVGTHTLYLRGHNNSSCGTSSGDVSNPPASITVNVQLSAFANTTATIEGQTSYNAFANEQLPVVVTVTREDGTNWRRTSYRYGDSGNWTCVNTDNHDGNGTDSETLYIDAPASTGPATLHVRAHANSNDCNDTPTEGGNSSVQISVNASPTPAVNPDLAASCGLNVILVLDESTSINQTSGATTAVRTAANAFLGGLKNTGSSVAIVEFNTQARQVFGYIQVNDANLITLQNYINNGAGAPHNGYDPSFQTGYTNWDDAFQKVEDLNDGSVAPLVVFITDGDPTTYGPGTDLNTSSSYTSNDIRVTRAIDGANEVKAQGSHILAVGVGAGLSSDASLNRLKLISGEQVYSGSGTPDMSTIDVIRVSDFSNLETTLRNIVTALCQSSVSITKLADPGTGVFAPAAGWEFSARARYPQTDGLDFAWIQPSGLAPAIAASATTGPDGTVNFQWKPNSTNLTSSVMLTETQQAGYEMTGFVCSQTSGRTTPTFTQNGNTMTIGNLAYDAIVTCEVKNTFQSNPALTLVKSASPATYSAIGDVISYAYTLTNAGNVTLYAPYSVSDNKTTVTCPDEPSSLAVGESVTCTATHVMDQADIDAGSVTNVARATAHTVQQQPITSNEDDATVTAVKNPALVLTKVAEQSSFDAAGDVLTYTLIATNTGNVTLHTVTISDPKLGNLLCTPNQPTTLLPGESLACTGDYPTTQADLDAGKVDNIATVDSDETEPTTDDATVPGSQNPALDIDKTGTTGPVALGAIIDYTITVTNTGNVSLKDVIITDAKLGLNNVNIGTLAVGESKQVTDSFGPVSEADLPSPILNTASASGTTTQTNEPVGPVTDDHTVDVTTNPGLTLTKVAEQDSFDAAGDILTYTLVATNTGNLTLHGVTISDPKLDALSCTPNQPAVLAPGESLTCTGDYPTIQADLDAGKVDNVATADSDETTPVTDDATVPGSKNPVLVLTKVAEQDSFNAVGDVLTYTLVATNTGNVTLHNVTISDPKLVDLTCTPDQPTTLLPGESLTCTGDYPITQADLDAGKVDNVATADSNETNPVNDTATVPGSQSPALTLVKVATPTTYDAVGDVISYTYTLTNAGNVTLYTPFTVIDDKTTVTCPDQPASLAIGESITCTATYNITQDDLEAGFVTNVAQATAYDPKQQPVTSNEDDETVTGSKSPALTLTKDVEQSSFDAVGDVLTYTLVARNTGNVTLHNVTISDPMLGTLTSCSPAQGSSLAPNAVMTCTGAHTITQADVDAGKVDNVATADSEETQPTTDDATVPGIRLEITAVPVCIQDAPYVQYNVKPVNFMPQGNPVTIRWIDVDDNSVLYEYTGQALSNTLLWPEAGLDADGNGNQWPGWSLVNGQWVDNGSDLRPQVRIEFSVNPVETVTVDYPPALPTCSTSPRASLGDRVWVDANNNGAQDNGEANVQGMKVTLFNSSDVQVGEPALTNASGIYTFSKLMPGSYYVKFDPTILPSGFIFTASNGAGVSEDKDSDVDTTGKTAIVTLSAGQNYRDLDAGIAQIALPAQPALTLTKSAAESSYDAVDDLIHYTLVAKNTGNVTLHNVTIVDAKLDALNCTPTLGSSLAPNAEMTCTGTYTITQADLDAGQVYNAASADSEETPPTTDDTTVPGGKTPALALTKSAAESSYDAVGDVIHYTLVAQNTGNVTLHNVTIVDAKLSTLTCTPIQPATLVPGATLSCQGSYSVTQADLDAGKVDNVATADSDESDPDTDDHTVPGIDPAPPALASLGDIVWFDTNKNGLQDGEEKGVAGVEVKLYTVEGILVKSDITDAGGKYLFADVLPGSYYVEFANVPGYVFTRYEVGTNGLDFDNSLDSMDSDPLVPWMEVGVSNGGVDAELGVPLALTFFYSNTSANLAASNVVVSTTVPTGTSFVAASSNPGWSCTNAAAGSLCTLTLETLDAGASGSVAFVLLLDASEPAVPDVLDLFVSVAQSTVARTRNVTLASGENNLNFDAGIVRIESSLQTATPTGPTGLPPSGQPQQGRLSIFLPTVSSAK